MTRLRYYCVAREERFIILRDNGNNNSSDVWVGDCWESYNNPSYPPKLYPDVSSTIVAIGQCFETGAPAAMKETEKNHAPL